MPKTLIDRAESYLSEMLKFQVKLEKRVNLGRMPFFLLDSYEFYNTQILGETYIVALRRADENNTPAISKKQLDIIAEITGQPVILLCSAVTSYNRKRLVEQGIQFIVPGNQMFLPEIGIDLREHFRSLPNKSSYLSPSAQSVLLSVIYSADYRILSTKILKERTGYSIMTLNRVFDELLDFDLIEQHVINNWIRTISFLKTGKALWDAVSPLCKNPCKRTKWIRFKIDKVMPYKLAGLSALAARTMIAPDRHPVIAMTNAEYKLGIRNEEFIELPDEWNSTHQVQIWQYNPAIVTQESLVDTLSLYLSFEDDDDSRTRGELERMMEKIQW